MVGIVLVSHSAVLAAAVKDLADQMSKGMTPIALAGGVDSLDNPFGTDAMKVVDAIESVYDSDGVLVLMDLGSAVLSAQMAIEDFLPPEWTPHIFLVDAPFVEGAVTAAVQAALGGSLEEVAAEARRGLAPKSDQLGQSDPVSLESAETDTRAGKESLAVIRNAAGLHARPAALFVETAAGFQSQIWARNLSTGSRPENGKSLIGVMRTGAQQGHQIAITARGPDSSRAVADLLQLVESGFGEITATPPPGSQSGAEGSPPEPELAENAHQTNQSAVDAEAVLQGLSASEGVAIGPAFKYSPQYQVEKREVGDVESEWQRYLEAVDKARVELDSVQSQAAVQLGSQDALIFDAHRQFLDDPEFEERVASCVRDNACNAEYAVEQTIDELADAFETMEDALLAQRAADLRDVGIRLIRLLIGGQGRARIQMPHPAVLVARDLMPSDITQLDLDQVLGIGTCLGGPMSHAAILARSLGIPTVMGLGDTLLTVTNQTCLLVDGGSGQVCIDPDAATIERFRQEQARQALERETARQEAKTPAVTRDGHRLEMAANIGGLDDVQQALDNGAEAVGVLRTEFLYLDRTTPPGEEEQLLTYEAVADGMEGRPVIIRTLDIGGDKPASYLDMAPELNPFLGCRAIRLSQANPWLFKTQLRAILRAGAGRSIKLMFPMIASLEELRWARSMVELARQELATEGLPQAKDIETGIMVEIPAAAIAADQLVSEVDFFSIGANDLVQYTMAVDRNNAQCAALFDPFHPAVLRQIDLVVSIAHSAGKWVGVCGEMAGEPLAIPILVGLGVDELSMSARAIPRAKQIVRTLVYSRVQEIARKALALDTGVAVQNLVEAQSHTAQP